uniref:PAS domain-containing protein n=1 Tax=Helicotheca tamesis TaxID=374047 RepID=A0A7S2I3C2_9STRA|mmetsp:Transcript_5339/g.7334  ORF Transcript_5339/g.7334 Transcript_5339/m.7334 type:complete len:183 (+) Transcript_5339:134-682(+)
MTMEKAFLTISSTIFGSENDATNMQSPPPRQFQPEKQISERDSIIVDMLNSPGHEDVSFCVCDPDLADCPIIYVSSAFCTFTGYDHTEIEGKNCRFLQGPETEKSDVDRIRAAIKSEVATNVNLLNYKKDGTKFINEFFISPLRDENQKLLYFIGVQVEVPKQGPGQAPSNPGWVYTVGNHS